PSQVNYSTLEQAVLELGGVVNVSVYRNLGSLAFELRNASGRVVGSYGVSQALAINPDRPPILIQDSKVSGSLTLPRGSVGPAGENLQRRRFERSYHVRKPVRDGPDHSEAGADAAPAPGGPRITGFFYLGQHPLSDPGLLQPDCGAANPVLHILGARRAPGGVPRGRRRRSGACGAKTRARDPEDPRSTTRSASRTPTHRSRLWGSDRSGDRPSRRGSREPAPDRNREPDARLIAAL